MPCSARWFVRPLALLHGFVVAVSLAGTAIPVSAADPFRTWTRTDTSPPLPRASGLDSEAAHAMLETLLR